MPVIEGVEAPYTQQKERPRFTAGVSTLLPCVHELFDFSMTGVLAKRYILNTIFLYHSDVLRVQKYGFFLANPTRN